MGAGSSSLLLNKRELQAAEREPLLLMDRILNFILTGIRDKDVFKMQDQATCQKYLLVSVQQLKSLFTEIQLYPVRGPGGKILFRKIEDITKPTEAAAKEQLAENCLAIGYFYVRILQLYLALALTIIDDPVIAGFAGQAPVAPGFQRGGQLEGESGRGGDTPLRGGGSEFTFERMTEIDDAHKFDDLSNVSRVELSGPGYYSLPRIPKTDPLGVRLIADKKSDGSFSTTKGIIAGFTKIDRSARLDELYRVDRPASDRQRDLKVLNTTIHITFKQGEYNTPNSIIIDYAIIKSNRGREQKVINKSVPITDDYKLMYPYGSYGGNIGYISTFLRTILKEFDANNYKSFISYINRIGQGRASDLARGAYDPVRAAYQPAAQGFGFQAQAAQPLAASSSQAPLDFRGALAAVQQTRPLAHCIARSYQLLGMDTMAGAKQARTQICNRSFMTRAKVPDGVSITGVEGIKALNLLYSVLDKTKIGLTARSSVGLQVALNRLAQAFGDGRQAASMDRIIARTPARCSGKTGPATISGAQDIGRAKAGVQALWAFQRKHVVAVAGMFKLLFNVSRDGAVIGFNPRILAGGIPYVEELVEKTQAILVVYYSQCESIYQNTVGGLNTLQLDPTGAGAGVR